MAFMVKPFDGRELLEGVAQATTTQGRQRERQRAALVLLNEAGIFAAPALYAPAGGVSGRTTLATIVWLTAWAVLHNRWKSREIAPGGVGAVTLLHPTAAPNSRPTPAVASIAKVPPREATRSARPDDAHDVPWIFPRSSSR
jgi:hypothetical protein